MANQGTFTSGQVLSAAELNGFTQVTALLQSTVQSIPSNTVTTVTFPDSEIVDVGGWHSTSTNNDRIIPTVNGIYLVAVHNQIIYSGGSIFYETGILKNGTLIAANTFNGSPYPGGAVAVVMSANGTTDYFASSIYQASGSAQNTLRATFSCTLLRAL